MSVIIYVNSEYLFPKDFMKWLDHKKYKFVDIEKHKNQNKMRIDFVYIDATTKKHIKKYIYKNINVGTMSYVITNIEFHSKDILHEYVEKKDPVFFNKFFLTQRDVNDETLQSLDPNKMYIVKPIPGFAGDGIKVFRGPKGIKKHIENIEKKSKQKDKWVIQDYIDQPLLLNGRKFHIRIIILLIGGNAYFYKDFIVYPAQKKFTLDDLSVEVHDTHGTLTESHAKKMFPADFTDMKNTKELYIKIANMFKGLRRLGVFKHKCYEDSENCYQLYGADVMVTKDYDVKCLEINFKPGLTNMLKRMPFLVKGILDLTLLEKEEGKGYYKI